MMKHIEELLSGEAFVLQNTNYIVTCDFDKNKNRLCIDLNNGHPRWLPLNMMVSNIELYTLNENNEIVSISSRKTNDK